MRVQKFNAAALQRILHQHKYPPNPYDYDEVVIDNISEIRTEIIEARDSWLAGKDFGPKNRIKIYEDGDKVVLETLDHKFRISGGHVTKEQTIF